MAFLNELIMEIAAFESLTKQCFIKRPYAKKCACNMHVTTNYMHVMVNMHVTLLLHECYMHVVRVLEMVAHVPCMLYEC